MSPNESPTVSVSRRGPRCLGSDPQHTVVRICGEHDIATRVPLSATLAEAASLDDADIVVDLSGVTFMDASTVGALIVARNHLRALSRSLSVTHPSGPAQRLLVLCGLGQLIDEEPAPARLAIVTALGSWVSVPAISRDRDPAPPPAPPEAAPAREPAYVRVGQRVEPTGAIQRRTPP